MNDALVTTLLILALFALLGSGVWIGLALAFNGLENAGLTKIPDLIQATIAKSATENPDTSLRLPCPDNTPDPGNIDCMPPPWM